MLPFASVDFFLLFGIGVLALHLLKPLVRQRLPLVNVLVLASLAYVVFYYPKPVQLLLFIGYQCVFTWLLLFRWRRLHHLLGSLILALPMVLVKLHWQVDIIGFAGLSYITFRCVQVYLDGEALRERFRFTDFITFLLFTPSLLAGPIDRYERFQDDLRQGWVRVNGDTFWAGMEMLLLGALHKFVLAEIVDRFWMSGIDAASTAVGDMASSMYAYTAYLYFDFAGYSLLAMGLGSMMGIALPKNFDCPWLTQNPPEFWRRWHITLGDWLRDYFFRPIYKSLSGMDRFRTRPVLRQNIALFSTFLLMGCWNGLEVHYIVSGALFGVYSAVYNSYQHGKRKRGKDIWGNLPAWAVKYLSMAIMINLGAFALYIFSGRFPFIQ